MGAHASPRWAHFHTCVWAHFRAHAYGRTVGSDRMGAHADGRTCARPYGRTSLIDRMGAHAHTRIWAHILMSRYGRTCVSLRPKAFVTVTFKPGQGDASFRHCDVMQVGTLA